MKITLSRKINAPASNVWALIADFKNIHRFHPLLKASDFIEGSCNHDIGATRQCDMINGSFLREKILDWKEDSHYTVEIYETSMPLSRSLATLGVATINEESSLAYMALDITARHRMISPLVYLLFRYYAGPAILRGLSSYLKKSEKTSNQGYSIQTA